MSSLDSSVLQRSSLFCAFAADDRQKILASGRDIALERGEVLFREGDLLNDVYLVCRGRLDYRIAGSANTDGGTLRVGEIAGELSLLNGKVATATVVARQPTWLLAIACDVLLQSLVKNHTALMMLQRKLMMRARHEIRGSTLSAPKTILAVPIEGAFNLEGLFSGLRGICRVVNLDQEPIYNKSVDLSAMRADDWPTLFLASARTPWEALARLPDADLVWFVGDDDRRLDGFAKNVLQRSDPSCCEWIRIETHPSQSSPSLEWQSIRTIDNRLKPLLHLITGEQIGLALGGGGVRAAAHIGFLEVMKRKGLQIDMLAGTSIGALIACLYAQGTSFAEMIHVIDKHVTSGHIFHDYTWPRTALLKGKRFERVLKELFGTRRLEELAISTVVAATNLATGKLQMIDRGPIWEAVRASASLPGILPPLMSSSGPLVDGGILDNLPALPLYRRGAKRVIAVDVGQDQERLQEALRINDVVIQSMMAASQRRRDETIEAVDVYVRLPVGDARMLDFKKMRSMVEIGREYAEENGDLWLQKIAARDLS